MEKKYYLILNIIKMLILKNINIGKTHIQKIVYLSTYIDKTIDYKYRMFHYGPYSDDLSSDMATMNSLNFITIESNPDGYGYNIILNDDEIQGDSYNTLELVSSIIDNLEEITVSYLEVITTELFVYNSLLKKGEEVSKEVVVEKSKKIKTNFENELFEKSYNNLVAMKLINN